MTVSGYPRAREICRTHVTAGLCGRVVEDSACDSLHIHRPISGTSTGSKRVITDSGDAITDRTRNYQLRAAVGTTSKKLDAKSIEQGPRRTCARTFELLIPSLQVYVKANLKLASITGNLLLRSRERTVTVNGAKKLKAYSCYSTMLTCKHELEITNYIHGHTCTVTHSCVRYWAVTSSYVLEFRNHVRHWAIALNFESIHSRFVKNRSRGTAM